jgi:nucleotide-binding universal stress UspA family protein
MRVLIAYDGGPAGEATLRALASWIHSANVEVHLVTVIDPKDVRETPRPPGVHSFTPQATVTGTTLPVREPDTMLAENRTQALVAAHEVSDERLLDTAAQLLGQAPTAAHTELNSDTPGAIVRLAKRLEVDVIAVGTHGRSGLQHAIFGSVAEQVVRRASVPVLVVGPQAVSSGA